MHTAAIHNLNGYNRAPAAGLVLVLRLLLPSGS